MKRVLISGALLLAAVAFVFLSTGASKGTAGHLQDRVPERLRPGHRRRLQGRRGAGGDDQGDQPGPEDAQRGGDDPGHRTGFGQFHQDASCESRPESLIGEYFVDCNPGSSGPVLKAGATIPVSHTQSTIPADLLQDTMRLPYRQRFSLIVNELGAAAAARSGDIQTALHRAVPALDETDNLLNLLANDSTTLQSLTKDSNSVITALANNSKNVNKFIDVAGKTAADTSTQQANLRTSLQRLPGLLEQLKPTIAQLGTTVTTNEPVLQNLNQASGQIDRLLTDLPAFSKSAKPAIKSLGQASVTGKAAVTAATPTVKDLNAFAKPTPELAGNLAIVLHDLDDPSRAVERDPRSPGGNGFTGLQALLGYVFNQTLAINTFGPEGHILAVDAFVSPMCSAYATPATIALAIKQYGPAYRQCYSWLGPNQPGVNETDPSDPERPRARSGRSAPRRDRSQHQRQPAHRGRGGERHQRQQEAAGAQKTKTTKGKKARARATRPPTPAPTPRRRPPAAAPPPAPAPRPAPAAARRPARSTSARPSARCCRAPSAAPRPRRRRRRSCPRRPPALRQRQLVVVGRHRPAAPQLPPLAMSTGTRQGKRARRPSALSNPVLVGAMTVLVIMVAVFLAYNANTGLPFVPTDELKVNVASGSDLVPGNEVREGGFLIGVVQSLTPIQLPSGQVAGQLTLKINKAYGKVPGRLDGVDPPAVGARPQVRGPARRHLAPDIQDGGTLPITQTSVPVQFEDIFQAFDAKTRKSIDQNLVGFGDTFAGRGSALNDTFASLPSLLGYLKPVTQYLADPNTELTRFFNNLEGVMGAVAPVAQTNAQLFTDMATTFQAIDHSPSDLESTIAKSPSTEQVSTQSLAVQRPFLADFNTLGTQLAPATAELKRRAARHQPGDRDRDQDARPHAGAQRQPPAGHGRAEDPVAGAGHQRRGQRAHRHGEHAQPDDPLPRPLPDGVR